jgi:SAM-dependent methyltransferase
MSRLYFASSSPGKLPLRRRSEPRQIVAAIDQPSGLDVDDHNQRVCRFVGWLATSSRHQPIVRVHGLGKPVQFVPQVPRLDVINAFGGEYELSPQECGFEFYIDIPAFESDHLPVTLEFRAGRLTAWSDTYRLMRDTDVLRSATYVSDTYAKRDVARRRLAGRGLEFGALHLPLAIDESRCSMEYADRLTKDQALATFSELRESFVGQIVEPRFLVDIALSDLSELEDERFDFFVANDVIEHLPNPIRFLESVASIMKPGAVLFLSVPDRDYSFDVLRDLTPLEHLWSEYARGVVDVDDDHLRDFLDNTGQAVPENFEERQAFFDWHRDRSIHVHVWDERSFNMFLRSVSQRLRLGLVVVEHVPSRNAGGSMVYALQKLSPLRRAASRVVARLTR